MPTASANGKIILFGEYAVLSGITGFAIALKDFSLTVTYPDTPASDLNGLLETATIHSNIPQGSGLGSSAALSVALARAILGEAEGDPESVFALAKGFEDEIHGGSSGIDTFTVISGGLCSISASNKRKFTKLPGTLLERLRRFKLSLIDTNSSRIVREIKSKITKTDLDEYLPVAQEISRTFQSKLEADQLTLPVMIELLNRSQEALVNLKVSTPLIQSIVSRLSMVGVGAKITGAGGGGCLLVVHDENVTESLFMEILVNVDVKVYYDLAFLE